MNILVANGVNLDLLGTREPDIYGKLSLSDIESALKKSIPQLESFFGLSSLSVTFKQTNSESEYLGWISGSWGGMVLNPAAWTHTSLALSDRLAAINHPFVEVHLSNIHAREEIRSRSLSAKHSLGVLSGLGADVYLCGLFSLLQRISHARP